MAELNPTQTSSKSKAKKVLKVIFSTIGIILIILVVIFTSINSPTYIAKMDNYLSKDQNKAQLEEFVRNDNLISNSLVIPTANIYAPISFPEGIDFFNQTKNLGITVHPEGGKIDETITSVIYGPSYGYFWKDGQYKYVFTSLRAAKIDDQIFIQHQNKTTEYKVINTETVLKSKFDPISEFENDLILYTEWPTGINTHWVVVHADKI